MPQAGSPIDLGRLRLEQLHHEADDVPRRAELAVDAGRGQLAEQVLVEVALGVALGERQLVDHVHRRDQQARLLDHELGVLHVLGEGRAAVAACGSAGTPRRARRAASRSASFCLKFFQRRGSSLPENRPVNGFLVRSALRSPVVSMMSSRRANIRNEICSMTVSGLVMPPVQNSVQSLSMSLFCWRQ